MTTAATPATPTRRLALRYGCAATASLCGLATTWPARAQPAVNQLRILCSGPAGSIPDIVARRVADQLTRQYPQGAMVDNRPGAAGQIAVHALKASAANCCDETRPRRAQRCCWPRVRSPPSTPTFMRN